MRLQTVFIMIGCAMLAACSDRPPECNSSTASETAKTILVDEAMKYLKDQAADDPDGLLTAFYKGFKVELSSIVSEGYRADAKKQLCRASFKLSTVNGETGEQQTGYVLQTVQDRGGGAIMEIVDPMPLVQFTASTGAKHYSGRRWSGEWNGTYACEGALGAISGPGAPFTMPVTMVVEGTEAKLERTTRGGGFERLTGSVFAGRHSTLELRGDGKNSPTDVWRTTFKGSIEGKRFTAEGVVQARVDDPASPIERYETVRKCRLELTLGGALPAAAATGTTSAAASAATPGSPAPVVSVPPGPLPVPPAPQAPTAQATGPSLCIGNERVLFACSTGKKLVSLCASNNNAEMRYRLGVLGQQAEMDFPDAGTPAASVFKLGREAFAGGGAAFVSFDRGEYRYVVFTGEGRGWTKEGVFVEKAGKRIAHLACVGDATTVINGAAMDAFKLPPDTRGLQLP